ncbi:AAA-like domain-containing protein [Nostoc parmelioides]|uniref:AAA-like domain-containing protein n=1 Tax=Nostoc parmelioides FACHB-3921 TaxID=2692909 RepID=A0ABR8BJ55_9NOSO|nr:AAA-like domain-containing protein [Nostoc parmelioides]MBD2253923.1 AAA-like domain-containing protein [Nostoc parmelioides FACHB-3921]
MKLKQNKTKRRRGVILTPKGLKRLQEAILSWEILQNKGDRLTLEQLSRQINVSTKTLSRLWSLSASVDHRTLKLCFGAFNLEVDEEDYTILTEENETEMSDLLTDVVSEKAEHLSPLSTKQVGSSLSYPDGAVPLNSPFYIERSPIEELVYREVTQPGCVIRIRAPRQMGKSSLVLRLLSFANTQNYHTVNLKCNQIDEQCFTNLNKLLRCICWQIATQLGLDPSLDDKWDEEIGCKLICSLYVQNYILKQCHNPIVLVLNDVDRLFEYPHIANDFFALLRSWCEEARQNHNWHKLRLVVVYSTEQYISLDINHSPFNVGLPIRLHEFTQQQVEDLARRYGLKWTDGKESARLMSLVGGHPALVQLALYYLSSGTMTLSELIQEAIANGGIYRHHLQRHWAKLQVNPHLARVYTELVTTKQSTLLDPMDAHKLESLGLICFEGDRVLPRCELYRTYFVKQLSTTAS